MVFVNYYANATTPLIFKAADHTAVAVDLYVAARAHNVSGKKNGEVH
jgi:hypothetical protein